MEQMILQDICKIYDCPHTTAKDEGIGIPLVRTPNVGKGRLVLANVHRVNADVYKERTLRAIPEEDDIIIAREAPVGNAAIIQKGQKVCLGQRVVLLKPIKDVVDPNFLVYYLLSNEVQHRLRIHANGAVVAHLNVADIRNLLVSLPSLNEQKRIGRFLKIIDDKIEQNHRINENLEQQAQALFKSWFIDFEPFKDGKFVDSELGMIPEGWKVIETNKFMTISKESINPSKNPNCFYAHYSIPAFDEKSMPIFQYGNEIKSNKQKVSDNMTLVSKLNPRIKRIWFIDKACENAICSTEFIPYISLNNSPYFLYCYLDSDVFYNSIMSSVNGATGSHQRFQANDTLKFLFPYNEEVIYKFNLVVSGILKHKSRLIIESQKLSQLRDTLLPRLMSGKLEIKDNSYD